MLNQIEAPFRKEPHLKMVALKVVSQRPEISEVESGMVENAKKHLRERGYEELRNVTCEYFDGVLVLRGRVSSYFLKQMAQVAVHGISGISFVRNAIDVEL